MLFTENRNDSIFFRSQGRLYCVACSEIDCDENSKDNPVLSAEAASHQVNGKLVRFHNLGLRVIFKTAYLFPHKGNTIFKSMKPWLNHIAGTDQFLKSYDQFC
jgi:hypothetical protein